MRCVERLDEDGISERQDVAILEKTAVLPNSLGTAGRQNTNIMHVDSVQAQRMMGPAQKVTSSALSQSTVTFRRTAATAQVLDRVLADILDRVDSEASYIKPTAKIVAIPSLRRKGRFKSQITPCGSNRMATSRKRLRAELERSPARELIHVPPPSSSLFQMYSRGTQEKMPRNSPIK